MILRPVENFSLSFSFFYFEVVSQVQNCRQHKFGTEFELHIFVTISEFTSTYLFVHNISAKEVIKQNVEKIVSLHILKNEISFLNVST